MSSVEEREDADDLDDDSDEDDDFDRQMDSKQSIKTTNHSDQSNSSSTEESKAPDLKAKEDTSKSDWQLDPTMVLKNFIGYALLINKH